MPLTIPPDLKKITQYIRRAEELDKDKNAETKLVAYYCRQYAVQQGIPILQSNPSSEGNACLGSIMASLEKEKKKMSVFSKEECQMICTKFANQIFDKADQVDRAGMANKSTAKTFYAAASFLDMLKQFEEDKDASTEEDKKSFYAKWKATDILKAIKEGRDPTPGGYGQDSDGKESEEDTDVGTDTAAKDEEVDAPPPPAYSPPDTTSTDDLDIPPPASSKPLPPPVLPPSAPTAPPSVPETPVEKVTNFMSGMGSWFGKPKTKVSKDNLDDAKELTKFALKALESKDTFLAAQRLKEALGCLVEEEPTGRSFE